VSNGDEDIFFGSPKDDWIFKISPTREYIYMRYYNLERLHA